MTPEAQNALVEIFRALELVMHKAPSNATVFRIVRDDCKLPFPDAEGKALLHKFRNARPGGAPVTHLVRTAPAPGIEHERASAGPDSLPTRAEAAGATRAGDKVFLVPKSGESGGDAPVDRSQKSPGFAFGTWFFEAMFAAGIDQGRALYPGAIGLATETDNLQAATALTSTYPVDECKMRAQRMIDRKNRTDQHRWHSRVSPAALLKHWDVFGDELVKPVLSVVPPRNESDFQRRNREQLERRAGATR